MSVPYFGTDGENATGVSGRDMSISATQQESKVRFGAFRIITTSSKSDLTKTFTFWFIQYKNKKFQFTAGKA